MHCCVFSIVKVRRVDDISKSTDYYNLDNQLNICFFKKWFDQAFKWYRSLEKMAYVIFYFGLGHLREGGVLFSLDG